MAKKLQAVTDAEFSLLEFLWENGPATKREIVEAVYPQCRAADYSTVQKLLERLEAKKTIRRDRSSFAHVIQPTLSREAFAGQQLQAVANKLSAGSLVPLLIQLVEGQQINAQDRKKIRKLLDEQD